MSATKLLGLALSLAVEAHSGEKDKSGEPYIAHPLRLYKRCTSEHAKLVALLHDAVETDSARPITIERLRTLGFPEPVLEALALLSHEHGDDYSAYIERLAGNALAREVKIYDLEDNMDIRRLKAPLTERDLRRTAKYHRAWSKLKEIA